VLVTCVWIAAGESKGADLMDLYGLAKASDPTFQSAQYTLEAAKQKRPEAFSGLLPALSANGADGRTQGRTRYTDTPSIDRTFNTDQWTIQLTQPVFRADRLLAYGEARATVEQAAAQYDAAREDLLLRLSRAYFDVIVAERSVTAARSQVVALNEQLQAARRSFDAGVASITDVDDTRSRAASARSEEVAALNNLESARAALEAVIGEPPEKLAALRDGVVLPKPFPSDVGDWVQHATSDNPKVKAAEAAAKAADYEVDRARAQRLPSVDLIATYGGNYAGGNITEPINYDTIVRDKQINLQVTVPLLDGGGMHAQVAEARAQRSRAQSDVMAAKRQAALDARQSFAEALSGVSQVDALMTAASAGQSALKGNQVGYGLGLRINSDVLNAEQQLYKTMQDLDKARYDTLYAGLKLKAATGELAEDDLRAINALLEAAP
jgi:outer membrane protein